MLYVQVHASFTVSENLQKLIEDKVRKLGTFHDKLLSAEVFLKEDEKRHAQALEQTVELNVQVPGQILHTEDHSDTFEKSLNAAVEKMRRQILKYKAQTRPHI
jgi:putative sigma-54 modulation protein